MKWELIKIVVVGESIQYLIKRAKNRNKEIKEIVNKIKKKTEKSINKMRIKNPYNIKIKNRNS